MDIRDLINEYLKDKQRDLENDCHNIVDDQIFSWTYKYVPQPTMEELQALAPKVEAKIAQAETNAKALAYLASTDYLVLRAIDDPTKPVPEEIKVLRQAARESIQK